MEKSFSQYVNENVDVIKFVNIVVEFLNVKQKDWGGYGKELDRNLRQ